MPAILTRYVVRDAKADAAEQPFYRVNDQVALREFEMLCNNPEHRYCVFAEDFALFRLGTFDQQSMKETSDQPLEIARALEMRRPEE